MSKIILNNDVVALVREEGMTFNEAIESLNRERIEELRNSSNKMKNLSATQIAMYDLGIGSNLRVDNVFKSEHSEILQPAFYADLVGTTMAESNIMSWLVGSTVGVDSDIVKTPMLDLLSDENAKNLKKGRVAEGGEFPIRKISVASKTTNLYKKGIKMEQTYEAARRNRIDIFGKMVRAVSTDIVRQNVDDAMTVLCGGTLYTIGTTATANTITRSELFDAVLDYFLKYGYVPTTIAADGDLWKEIMKVVYPTDEATGVSAKIALNSPQFGNVSLDIVKGSVPAKGSKARAILYNKDYSLVKYNENGASLTEYAPDISRQMNEVVISEVSGFGKLVDSVAEIVSA